MTTPETVNLEDAAAELIELAGVAECIDHVLQSKLRSARRGA